MIPLGQWLRTEPGCTSANHTELLLTPAAVACEAEEITPPAPPETAAVRMEELEQALAEALQLADQVRIDAAAREQALHDSLGSALASQLNQDISSGFATLQQSVEAAVADILTCLLGETVARRAAGDLLVLLRRAIEDAAEPLVELRIPHHLQDCLMPSLGDLPGAVRITEGPHVELTFSRHCVRFEELSRLWRATLLEEPA